MRRLSLIIASRYIGRYVRWYFLMTMLTTCYKTPFLKHRAEARLSTWLYRIAVNETITFLNKQRQQNHVPLEGEDLFLLDKLEADEWFDGNRLQKRLQEAILKLPEKQRLVFNMRYFDDMKYEEMSRILGTSVGALKASYHHAVRKIEEYLTSDD